MNKLRRKGPLASKGLVGSVVSVMSVLKGAPICRLFIVSNGTLAPGARFGNVWSAPFGRARLNPRWTVLSLFDSASPLRAIGPSRVAGLWLEFEVPRKTMNLFRIISEWMGANSLDLHYRLCSDKPPNMCEMTRPSGSKSGHIYR